MNPADLNPTSLVVTGAFTFIAIVTISMLILITISMIYCIIKYDRKKNVTPSNIEGNALLEIVWTIVPTVLVLGMFFYGWRGYKFMRNAPGDAMKINVTAMQWAWIFNYENGKQTDKLYIPFRKPIKLIMTSKDVIHSLYIPFFKVKEDVLPKRETTLWFQAEAEGSYDIFCAEYCGLKHSGMISKVVVLQPKKFKEWYDSNITAKVTDILKIKGCQSCHSTDGTKVVGPSFKGIYGSIVTVLTDGRLRQLKVDDEYIKKSIQYPKTDIVKEFKPVMPPQNDLTEKDIEKIIIAIKELK